jgi:hypothetical protein
VHLVEGARAVVAACEQFVGELERAPGHGAELEDLERLSAVAHTSLPIDDRASAGRHDHERDGEEERRQHEECGDREGQLQHPTRQPVLCYDHVRRGQDWQIVDGADRHPGDAHRCVPRPEFVCCPFTHYWCGSGVAVIHRDRDIWRLACENAMRQALAEPTPLRNRAYAASSTRTGAIT